MSVGRSFGELLRALAIQEYGSLAAFAAAVSLSRGRLSQIASGQSGSLTYPTLVTVMHGFPRAEHRELLYQAWLGEYAAPPTEDVPLDNEEAIDAFFLAVPGIASAGAILGARDRLRELWVRLPSEDPRSDIKLKVGQALVWTYLALDRPFDALPIARSMREIARSQRASAWIGTSLWTEAMALRNVRGVSPQQVVNVLTHLQNYLREWQPRSEPGIESRKWLYETAVRDLAIAGWDLAMHDRAGSDQLQSQMQRLRDSFAEVEDLRALALGREAEARCLSVAGDFDAAAEALDAATPQYLEGDTIHAVKVQIGDARLALRQGKRDLAIGRLEPLLDICERDRLFHYHRVVSDLLTTAFVGPSKEAGDSGRS